MMQVVPKWQVVVAFKYAPTMALYIHDNFLSNVLRKLADISFEKEPMAVNISRVPLDD